MIDFTTLVQAILILSTIAIVMASGELCTITLKTKQPLTSTSIGSIESNADMPDMLLGPTLLHLAKRADFENQSTSIKVGATVGIIAAIVLLVGAFAFWFSKRTDPTRRNAS